MNRMLLILLLVGISTTVFGQKYFTKEGLVRFESDAPLEKIEAVNDKATCVWDTESGAIQVAILIKSFQFEKALMQEHFNENYMESSKFPKATFKGNVTNMDKIDLGADGNYTASLTGEMTIHGVTKEVTTDASIVVEGGAIKGLTTFELAVADYEIEIPKLVRENIAKVVSVDAEFDLKPLDK